MSTAPSKLSILACFCANFTSKRNCVAIGLSTRSRNESSTTCQRTVGFVVLDDNDPVYIGCMGLPSAYPRSFNMSSVFEFAPYVLVVLAGVASLAVLGNTFRQRSSLQHIPGPPNPSLFWGKLRGLEEHGSYA